MMVNSALATGDFFELSPAIKLYCLSRNILPGGMLVRSFILGLDVDFCCTKFTSLTKNETKYTLDAAIPSKLKNSLQELKIK
jgi:O-succinylbenzoic acid--CoA ligase